jgi:hypothetical protein
LAQGPEREQAPEQDLALERAQEREPDSARVKERGTAQDLAQEMGQG